MGGCLFWLQPESNKTMLLSCVTNTNAISLVTFQMYDVRTFSVTTGLRARKSTVRIPVNVMVTFTLEQATKAQRGSGCIAILNFMFC